jgi:TolB-like protein
VKRGAWLLLLLAAPAFAGNALAVLPFKNLNADPATDWLKLGIAETMVADLKKTGLTMVERDQVDKALAELALQGQKLDEDSRAAKAGKLMGASSVVVGGYQKAGDQLRITARFVSVETGVVERTAKVTGSMTDVFSLQDQVVAELLKGAKPASGGQVKGHAPPPRRPATEKTLKAYQTYAMAISSSSQADKIEKLQEALELDPDFSYAADDLKALRARLRGYDDKAVAAQDAESRKLFAEILKPGLSAMERNGKIAQYFAGFISSNRWAACLEDAKRIYGMKNLEATTGIDPRELASNYIHLSLKNLKKYDLALQAGERHLKEFPHGNMRSGVDLSMKLLIAHIERIPKQQAEGRRELQDLEKDGPPKTEQLTRIREFGRCSVASRAFVYEEADTACTLFLEKYRGKLPDEFDMHALAGFVYSMCLNERGQFEKARTILTTTIQEHPEWASQMSADNLLKSYPRP